MDQAVADISLAGWDCDVSSLVPDCYSQWRETIADAFRHFVAQLPKTRREAIAASQAALPRRSPAAVRLVHLMHECPTLHKLGQVIARHRSLDVVFRRQLQSLESFEPRTPWEDVEPIIHREMSPAVAEYGLEIETTALAEASVAVVVPCTWRTGGSTGRQRAVLKVRKPGVEKKINDERQALSKTADYLCARVEQGGNASLDFRDAFDSVQSLLAGEVDFVHERQNLVRASALFREARNVAIPEALPFSTPDVIAMQRLDGIKVNDWQGDVSGRNRMALTIVESLLAGPMFEQVDASFFHADPHGGNLLALSDERLGVLDWSLTGSLSASQREQLMAAMLAGAMMDEPRLHHAVTALCSDSPTASRIGPVVQRGLARAAVLAVPSATWLISVLDDAVRVGASFPADLLLFRKALLTISGVVSDLDARVSIDDILLTAMGRAFFAEWPSRVWTWPASRSMPTRLSNLDLAMAAWQAPAAAMRRWAAWVSGAAGR